MINFMIHFRRITVKNMLNCTNSGIKKEQSIEKKAKSIEKQTLLTLVERMMDPNPKKRITFKKIQEFLNGLERITPNELDLIDKKNIDKHFELIGEITENNDIVKKLIAFDFRTSEFVLLESYLIKNEEDQALVIYKNHIMNQFQNLKTPIFAKVLSIFYIQNQHESLFQIVKEYGDPISFFNTTYIERIDKFEAAYYIIYSILIGLSEAEENDLILNNIKYTNIIIKKIMKEKNLVKFLDTPKGFIWKKGVLSQKNNENLKAFIANHNAPEVSQENKGINIDPYKMEVYSAGILIKNIFDFFRILNEEIDELPSKFLKEICAIKKIVEQMTVHQFEQRPYFSEIVSKLNITQSNIPSEIRTKSLNLTQGMDTHKYYFDPSYEEMSGKVVKQLYRLSLYSKALEMIEKLSNNGFRLFFRKYRIFLKLDINCSNLDTIMRLNLNHYLKKSNIDVYFLQKKAFWYFNRSKTEKGWNL